MPDRTLNAEERALWSRVAATVTPIAGRAEPVSPPPPRDVAARNAPLRTIAEPGARPVRRVPTDTLDGGWDRRLRRGTVSPDRAIDLHGHTLASAQAALEAALAEAVAAEARVMLVVTGKPPRAGEARRGLIRASIFDWLARSRHAGAIAAVRGAHPRHGGAGALYIILRRAR